MRSKRRKTSEIIVDKNGEIMLRVTYQTSNTDIEKILNNKIRWAIIKQKEFQSKRKDIIKPTFENLTTLPYLSKNFALHIASHDDNNYSNRGISD